MTSSFSPLIFLIPFVFFLNPCIAQDEVAGKEIVNKTVEKYKSLDSYKVNFDYIFENRMEESKDTQSGVFYVKDKMFRIDLDDQLIVTDNKTIWTYLKSANEVQVTDYDPEDLEISPNKIFTYWDKGFLAGYSGDTRIDGKFTNLVELTPLDKSTSFYKVKLFIEENTNEIVRIQSFYKAQGIVITFNIIKTQTNVNLDDHLFQFNKSKYPGIQVVDLRN